MVSSTLFGFRFAFAFPHFGPEARTRRFLAALFRSASWRPPDTCQQLTQKFPHGSFLSSESSNLRGPRSSHEFDVETDSVFIHHGNAIDTGSELHRAANFRHPKNGALLRHD